MAEIGRLKLSGLPAWLGVHLVFLIGFRNKLAVLLQWAYAYFAYKRGARLITGLSQDVNYKTKIAPPPTKIRAPAT